MNLIPRPAGGIIDRLGWRGCTRPASNEARMARDASQPDTRRLVRVVGLIPGGPRRSSRSAVVITRGDGPRMEPARRLATGPRRAKHARRVDGAGVRGRPRKPLSPVDVPESGPLS